MNTTTKNDVDFICRKLKLGQSVRNALKSSDKGAEYMRGALMSEISDRQDKRANQLIKKARFPQLKTFAGYEFDGISFPHDVAKEYFVDANFVADRRGLFLYGAPGTGKTHFAIAAGINACIAGFKTRFIRAFDLAEMLRNAASRNELQKTQISFKKLDLMIIDEFGFYPTDAESIRMLFEFFSSCIYEQQAFILTSNTDFGEFVERSNEPKMAAAVIDRVIHMSHLIQFEGGSHRLKHSSICG